MRKLAEIIYYRSKIIILSVILLNIIALLSFFNFSFTTDYLSFFKGNNEISSTYDEINEKYQGVETIQILIESNNGEDLTTQQNLASISSYTEQLGNIEGKTFINSFLPQSTKIDNKIISIDENFINQNYKETLTAIDNDYMNKQLISEDKKAALIILGINESVDKTSFTKNVTSLSIDDNLSVDYAGTEIIYSTIKSYLIKFIIFFPPSAALLILLTFYFNIRNRKATIFAMLPAIFAALWTFGTFFLLNKELSIITILAPIFIIILGSADGLHYTIHYLDNSDKYSNKIDLIEDTLHIVGIPIIMTSLTTMAGFISLSFSDIIAMKELGLTTALGIGYAGIISIFFLPALMTKVNLNINNSSLQKKKNNHIVGFFKKATNYKIAIFSVFLIIAIFFGAFIPSLTVDSNQLAFFKKGSDIVQTFDKIEEHFGSASPLYGEYYLPENNFQNVSKANEILEFERELENDANVIQIMSIYDIIQIGNQQLTGNIAYPADSSTISTITGILKAQTSINIDQWVSEDGLKFMITTTKLSGQEQDELINIIESEQNVKALTGMPVLFREMNKLIVDNQINSLTIALILIFILLFISFRKFKDTIVALVPILITIITIFGFLAITNMNLNMMTTNMSNIALGVGIDYSIHFIFVINYYRKKNESQYIDKALEIAGKPILTNALGLAIGLSVFLFSPFRIHTQVSLVMWIAMITACCGALLLIPQFYKKNINS